MPMEQEKSTEFGPSHDHGQTVVSATDRGELITLASLSPFGCVAENAKVLT